IEGTTRELVQQPSRRDDDCARHRKRRRGNCATARRAGRAMAAWRAGRAGAPDERGAGAGASAAAFFYFALSVRGGRHEVLRGAGAQLAGPRRVWTVHRGAIDTVGYADA